MTPEMSSQWVEDIFQTELYVRMYATTPGNLIIKTYEEVDNITDYVVAKVAAVVDNENMTSSAVLPAGTNRNEAIKNANSEKALQMLESCQLCGKCSMVCPRGINTRHLILSITKVYSQK